MKIRIEFTAELPDINHSQEELENFLRFQLRDNGKLSGGNPFRGQSVEPIFGTLEWEYQEVNEDNIMPF